MPDRDTSLPPEQPRERPVTLRDIARELGVSHVTVSLALRNHPRISEATRTRVQDKAEEMGYHPDPMLSALSHYRLTSKDKPLQATLAWVNPLQNPEALRQLEEFSLYWKGAEAIARRLGFHLEEFATRELSLKRMNTIFKTRGVRGLIIVPLAWETTPIDWDAFPWEDYAAVRFGGRRQGPLLHVVTSDQAAGAILAFEKAQIRGYQRIGFFGLASPRRMFSAGYLRAQESLPGSERLPLIYIESDVPADQQRDMLATWMKEHEPDAILTDSSLLPSLLEDLGYRVPEDVGIATMSIHDTPIDAGINQNPEEIGRAAIRTLVSLLNEHHFGIPQIRNRILVEGHWVDGSTLPDRGQRPPASTGATTMPHL